MAGRSRRSEDPRQAPLYRDRRFATYWTAQGVSDLGDRVSELAIPLIAVTTLHATPTQVGVVTAAVWAPNLMAILTGAWIDQRPRKRPLLVLSHLVQGLTVLTLPLAHWLGTITVVQLVAVALVAGAARTVDQTANVTFFVALVRRDQYVEANSLLSTTRSGSFVVGPAAGGLLIQAVSAPVAMLVDAISFFASAGLIRRIDVQEPVAHHETSGATALRRAAGGARYLWAHPYLSASLRCCTTLNFFSYVVAALLVLYASRELGLSAGVIGLAFGVGALGGLAGALLAPRVGRRLGTGPTIALGVVLFSAPVGFLPLAAGADWTAVVALAGVEALSGAGVMLFDVNLNALQTAVTSDAMRSRVSGAFTTVNYGIRPLGAVVGGVAGEVLGIAPTLVVAAIGGSLSLLWLVRSPVIRARTIDGLQAVPAS